MIAVIFGIVCILFAGFAVIPFSGGLNWTEEFIFVLKGGLPILGIALGFLCLLIGIADLLDKKHSKKEALLQKAFEEKQEKKD